MKEIELWFDRNDRIKNWNTANRFALLLVEHGSILLRVNDMPLLCPAPALVLINQNSRVEFINSTLLRASRITFESVFINVNLKPDQVCLPECRQIYREHHIDKLALFLEQDEQYFGLLPLSNTVFHRLSELFIQVKNQLDDVESEHWRCNVRDPLLAILSLATVVHNEMTALPSFFP